MFKLSATSIILFFLLLYLPNPAQGAYHGYCPAGEQADYLGEDDNGIEIWDCLTCFSGSYCPGGYDTESHYDCPSPFDESEYGAKSISECYTDVQPGSYGVGISCPPGYFCPKEERVFYSSSYEHLYEYPYIQECPSIENIHGTEIYGNSGNEAESIYECYLIGGEFGDLSGTYTFTEACFWQE